MTIVVKQRVFDALPRRDVDQVLIDLADGERELAAVIRAANEADHPEHEPPVCEVQLPAHVLHQGHCPVPILKELENLLLGGEWQVRGCKRRRIKYAKHS